MVAPRMLHEFIWRPDAMAFRSANTAKVKPGGRNGRFTRGRRVKENRKNQTMQTIQPIYNISLRSNQKIMYPYLAFIILCYTVFLYIGSLVSLLARITAGRCKTIRRQSLGPQRIPLHSYIHIFIQQLQKFCPPSTWKTYSVHTAAMPWSNTTMADLAGKEWLGASSASCPQPIGPMTWPKVGSKDVKTLGTSWYPPNIKQAQ